MKNNDYYYDEFNNPLPKKESFLGNGLLNSS